MSLLLHTLLFLLVLSSYARLVARDSSPSPQPLYIPVTVDNQGVYSVNVNMSSGTPQQFSFALSTSTGYTAVAGKSCSSCNGVNSYDQSASSSAVADGNTTGGFTSIAGSVNGTFIREDCKLHQLNGSAWSYPNQTVIVANQAVGQVFSPGISGVFGLGTNSRDGNFDDTVYAGFFRRNPTKTNFTFGMALNPPPTDGSSSTDGGQLHWLAPDSSAYTGDVQWKPMVPATTGTTVGSNSIPADWTIELDGFSFTSGTVSITQSQSGLLTILDPWFTGIVFPQSQVPAIYSSIPGASIVKQSDVTNVWQVPCDTRMSLTLTFGSIPVVFDESTLIRVENGQCLGVIEDWINPSDTQYLLGSSVLSKIYLIFSITNAQNGQVGIAQRSESAKKFETMAIVGVVLGSVAFLVMLVVVGWLFWRHRRKQQLKEKSASVEPYNSTTSQPTSPRENVALLGPGSTSIGPTPLSSPSWYAGGPSPPSSSAHNHTSMRTTLTGQSSGYPTATTRPSTVQLSSESGETAGDEPPPYVVTTQWPRTLPTIPMAQPPSSAKRRPAAAAPVILTAPLA